MDVEAIPTTDFVHDRVHARTGRAVMLPAKVAETLERRGLVRVRSVPQAGKAPAAGGEQLSSVSPAAPALPQTMSPESGAGEMPRRKSVARSRSIPRESPRHG